MIPWSFPLVVACATSQPVERPVQPPVTFGVHQPPEPAPPPQPYRELYNADEALDDVLSSDLEYLGTGRWPSIERSQACAFRNRRVLVVNVYCTLVETHAFSIDIFSPQRGRLRIYAEANGRFSSHRRSGYFTFTIESGLPPSPETLIPPVTLGMSYEQLHHYERQRYAAFLPGCHGGERNHQPVGNCLGSLAARSREFAARNRTFLARGSDEWYRVVRQMRTLAERHGRNQDSL